MWHANTYYCRRRNSLWFPPWSDIDVTDVTNIMYIYWRAQCMHDVKALSPCHPSLDIEQAGMKVRAQVCVCLPITPLDTVAIDLATCRVHLVRVAALCPTSGAQAVSSAHTLYATQVREMVISFKLLNQGAFRKSVKMHKYISTSIVVAPADSGTTSVMCGLCNITPEQIKNAACASKVQVIDKIVRYTDLLRQT